MTYLLQTDLIKSAAEWLFVERVCSVGKNWETVAIIGVGLIGGSIGLALRKRGLAKQVVGIGRRESSLQNAKDCQAVTRTTTDIAAGVKDADLIVVCTPVQLIVDHVKQVAQHCPSHALIVDAGSTKAKIVAQLDHELVATGPKFVGCHPMAGSEKSGVRAATDDLYTNRTVVVTPTEQTDSNAVAQAVDFWSSLDARVVQLSPQVHDETVAATSHLPHVLASLLAAATSESQLSLVATGWLDTTRVAAGDVELWKQILDQNRTEVLKSIENFAKVLASFQESLEQEDYERIVEQLSLGKQRRDAVGS